MPQRVSLGRGLVERIGELKGKITQKTPKGDIVREVQVPHHKAAMQMVCEALTDPALGALGGLDEMPASVTGWCTEASSTPPRRSSTRTW